MLTFLGFYTKIQTPLIIKNHKNLLSLSCTERTGHVSFTDNEHEFIQEGSMTLSKIARLYHGKDYKKICTVFPTEHTVHKVLVCGPLFTRVNYMKI